MKAVASLWLAALLLLLLPTDAKAGHRHHHHGGHHHFHGGFGGGHAYRHWGGFGHRPWGGVSLSIGFRPRYYGLGGYGLGGYGYRGYGYGNYGWGGYYGSPFGLGSSYSSFYQPVVYRSFYSGPAWSTYDVYGPPYYYYQSPTYYYGPTYTYPVQGYVPWNGFGSQPSVNVTNIVVRRKFPEPRTVVEHPEAFERRGMVKETSTLVGTTSIGDQTRARRLIRLGDEAFRADRYIDALNHYRNATEAAPRFAEGHFRKGHAYLANGQHAAAANAFRKALQLEPTAQREAFRLDDLYGIGSKAKTIHLESLAAAGLTNKDSADVYFLLGLMLRFDGHATRAEKFFVHAAALSPETRTALARLLPVEAEERVVSYTEGDEI